MAANSTSRRLIARRLGGRCEGHVVAIATGIPGIGVLGAAIEDRIAAAVPFTGCMDPAGVDAKIRIAGDPKDCRSWEVIGGETTPAIGVSKRPAGCRILESAHEVAVMT